MIEDTTESIPSKSERAPNSEAALSEQLLIQIAESFAINGPIKVEHFPGRGNINLTYSITAGERHYLLQRVNSEVFTMPHRVMNSMLASLDAQKDALAKGLGNREWEPIELVPTKQGKPFLEREGDWSVWRMMVRIPRVVSFKSLDAAGDRERQLALAEETGRGLGIYTDLTFSMDPSGIESSLPGYRDSELYFEQFLSILAGNKTFDQATSHLPADPIIRSATEQHFLVSLGEKEFAKRMGDPSLQPFIKQLQDSQLVATKLWKSVNYGAIPRTLIHGDTKLENFLFDEVNLRVKSLVDLDTVMAFTWLADWGDMLRSLVNVAGECERDLEKITVDEGVYRSVSSGFFKASTRITNAEIELMHDAVCAITLELGMRFLTDYLRGDSYFKLAPDDPVDLNKTRALVQLTLFEKLTAFSEQAQLIIHECRS